MCVSISRERSAFVAVCCCLGLVAFSARNHARKRLSDCQRGRSNMRTRSATTANRAFGEGAQPERSLPRARGPARGGAVSRRQHRRLFAVHTCTVLYNPSGFRSRTQKIDSTLPKRADFFRPKRPNPYSGSQLTATAQSLIFFQARWSRAGILKRCPRALTVFLYSTYYTYSRASTRYHRQEISYLVLRTRYVPVIKRISYEVCTCGKKRNTARWGWDCMQVFSRTIPTWATTTLLLLWHQGPRKPTEHSSLYHYDQS